MVSTCILIRKTFRPFTNSLGIVPSAPITFSIDVTFIFHNFFSLARSYYLSHFCFLLIFLCGLPAAGGDYITPCEFFTPALDDDFSLEADWQQIPSSLQDSFQYSARHQQCCSLDSLCLSSDFQFI